jgi:hypothetical protein
MGGSYDNRELKRIFPGLTTNSSCGSICATFSGSSSNASLLVSTMGGLAAEIGDDAASIVDRGGRAGDSGRGGVATRRGICPTFLDAEIAESIPSSTDGVLTYRGGPNVPKATRGGVCGGLDVSFGEGGGS